MPTIFRKNGFRFFFYSNEHPPPHVHIEGSDGTAKYNLDPIELIESMGLSNKDQRHIQQIIEENQTDFLTKWKNYFKN